MSSKVAVTGGSGCFIAMIVMFVAWLTHVITCIVVSKYLLLIIGAFFFPIGIIHGIMIWFGFGIA